MRIQPWTEPQLIAQENEFQALIEQAVTRTVRTALRKARADVLTSATTRQATASLEVAQEAAEESWTMSVDNELFPYLVATFTQSAETVTAAVEEATGAELEPLTNIYAAEFLEYAHNRLVDIGQTVWESLRDELSAGFAAGESIPQIARRLQDVTELSSYRAQTIARTEVISAANAGSYLQMLDVGFDDDEVTKVWLATEDPRTRKSHRHADNQGVNLTGEFTVDIYTGDVKTGEEFLEFPGDPSGTPGNTINCRCSLAFDFDEDEPLTAAVGDDFQEHEHPRDKDGKFKRKGAPDLYIPKLDPFPTDPENMKKVLHIAENINQLNNKQAATFLKKLAPEHWDALPEDKKKKLDNFFGKLADHDPDLKEAHEHIDALQAGKVKKPNVKEQIEKAVKEAAAPKGRALGGTVTKTGKVWEPGKDVKLRVQLLYNTTFEDGAIMAVNKDKGERIVWDANANKIHRQKLGADGKYATIDTKNKKQAYDAWKDEDGWTIPSASDQAEAPTAPAAAGLPAAGKPVDIKVQLIYQTPYNDGDVVVVNPSTGEHITWDAGKKRMIVHAADGSTKEFTRGALYKAYKDEKGWHKPATSGPMQEAAPVAAPTPVVEPIAAADPVLAPALAPAAPAAVAGLIDPATGKYFKDTAQYAAWNGKTLKRTSKNAYTHASIMKTPNSPQGIIWGFHKSEANALKASLTSAQKKNGYEVIGAVPVSLEDPDKVNVPAAATPEPVKVPEPIQSVAPANAPTVKKPLTNSKQVKTLEGVADLGGIWGNQKTKKGGHNLTIPTLEKHGFLVKHRDKSKPSWQQYTNRITPKGVEYLESLGYPVSDKTKAQAALNVAPEPVDVVPSAPDVTPDVTPAGLVAPPPDFTTPLTTKKPVKKFKQDEADAIADKALLEETKVGGLLFEDDHVMIVKYNKEGSLEVVSQATGAHEVISNLAVEPVTLNDAIFNLTGMKGIQQDQDGLPKFTGSQVNSLFLDQLDNDAIPTGTLLYEDDDFTFHKANDAEFGDLFVVNKNTNKSEVIKNNNVDAGYVYSAVIQTSKPDKPTPEPYEPPASLGGEGTDKIKAAMDDPNVHEGTVLFSSTAFGVSTVITKTDDGKAKVEHVPYTGPSGEATMYSGDVTTQHLIQKVTEAKANAQAPVTPAATPAPVTPGKQAFDVWQANQGVTKKIFDGDGVEAVKLGSGNVAVYLGNGGIAGSIKNANVTPERLDAAIKAVKAGKKWNINDPIPAVTDDDIMGFQAFQKWEKTQGSGFGEDLGEDSEVEVMSTSSGKVAVLKKNEPTTGVIPPANVSAENIAQAIKAVKQGKSWNVNQDIPHLDATPDVVIPSVEAVQVWDAYSNSTPGSIENIFSDGNILVTKAAGGNILIGQFNGNGLGGVMAANVSLENLDKAIKAVKAGKTWNAVDPIPDVTPDVDAPGTPNAISQDYFNAPSGVLTDIYEDADIDIAKGSNGNLAIFNKKDPDAFGALAPENVNPANIAKAIEAVKAGKHFTGTDPIPEVGPAAIGAPGAPQSVLPGQGAVDSSLYKFTDTEVELWADDLEDPSVFQDDVLFENAAVKVQKHDDFTAKITVKANGHEVFLNKSSLYNIGGDYVDGALENHIPEPGTAVPAAPSYDLPDDVVNDAKTKQVDPSQAIETVYINPNAAVGEVYSIVKTDNGKIGVIVQSKGHTTIDEKDFNKETVQDAINKLKAGTIGNTYVVPDSLKHTVTPAAAPAAPATGPLTNTSPNLVPDSSEGTIFSQAQVGQMKDAVQNSQIPAYHSFYSDSQVEILKGGPNEILVQDAATGLDTKVVNTMFKDTDEISEELQDVLDFFGVSSMAGSSPMQAPATSPSINPTPSTSWVKTTPMKLTAGVLTGPKSTKYQHGQVIAEHPDDRERIYWDANKKKYVVEAQSPNGNWNQVASYNKSAALAAFKDLEGYQTPFTKSVFPSGGTPGQANVPGVNGKPQVHQLSPKTSPNAPTSLFGPNPKFTVEELQDQANKTVANLSDGDKKSLYDAYRSKGQGGYATVRLSSPPKDHFEGLLEAYVAHNKANPNNKLSLLQLVRAVDEVAAKDAGVTNNNGYEKKIIDWLQTSEGKTSAQNIATQVNLNASTSGDVLKFNKALAKFQETADNRAKGSAKYKQTAVLALQNQSNIKTHVAGQDYPHIMNKAEGDKLAAEMSAKYGFIPAESKSAMIDYTGTSYTPMNEYMRTFGKHSNYQADRSHKAEQGMAPSTQAITVHRNVGTVFDGEWKPTLAQLKNFEGTVFREDAFASTSNDGHVFNYGTPYRFIIEVPEGTPLRWVQDFSAVKSENEILLGSGLHYEIISVHGPNELSGPWDSTSNKTAVIKMRVVPPPPDALTQLGVI